jgi:hypothetical protein
MGYIKNNNQHGVNVMTAIFETFNNTTLTLPSIGATVAIDSEGYVYVRKDGESQWRKVFSEWGGAHNFEYSWQDGQGGGTTTKVEFSEQTASSTDAAPEFWLAVRQTQTFGSDSTQAIKTKVTWDIYKVKTKTADSDSSSNTQNGMYGGMYSTGNNVPEGELYFTWSDSKHSMTNAWTEIFFNRDLNKDDIVGFELSSLSPVQAKNEAGNLYPTDTNGARLETDLNGDLFISTYNSSNVRISAKPIANSWVESYYSWGDGFHEQKAMAVQEVLSGNVITGYKLAVRSTSNWNNQEQITWNILHLNKDGEIENGYWDEASNKWVDKSIWGITSISAYEKLFNQDLNQDGFVGINIDSLKPNTAKDINGVEYITDTNGVRLERDDEGGLYIVTYVTDPVTNLEKRDSFKLIQNSWIEYYNSWGDGFNEQKAMAVQEVVDSNNVITGYKLAVRSTNKWSDQETVSWTIYHLDTEGKIDYGYWDSNAQTYVDKTIRDVSSIGVYEALFNEDLNKDGFIGIDKDKLTYSALDTKGARLARDTENGLYIVEGSTVKAVGNASWLEYDYGWGSSRKAIAVEAKSDGSGYVMAVQNTNQMWNGSESKPEISWDIIQLDKDGKVTYGFWDSSTNQWKDETIYGVKSIAIYETLFNDDLNGDGFIGVRLEDLTLLTSDTVGAKLARDSSGGLYIVHLDNSIKAVSNAGWLEYDYGSSSKREAIAVEEEFTNGVLTGYRLALKNTNAWSVTATTTWDIMFLDTTGKLTYGYQDTSTNRWVDKSVYGAKSVAPYEVLFNQDLNGDGRIGIDVSQLNLVQTDTFGVRLARDNEGGLYYITGSGDSAVANVVSNAGWLEYDYGWGSSRQAVAIEAIKNDAGNTTGYKLALKSTNNFSGSSNTVTWDILHLDSSGQVLYGYWDSNQNVWVDESIWGSKSIAAYEDWFEQDLNGDGFIGIDLTTLTPVDSDTNGARLRRDKEGALYVVNTNAAGVEVAKPIGNASWLEYNYSWSGYQSSREAIAIEAVKNSSGDITGYKLALKQTNNWSGVPDVNYEVLTLNANASITYSMGGSLWTQNIRLVESLINEDLDGDGEVGVPLSSLQQISVTTGANNKLIRELKDLGFNNIQNAPGLMLAINPSDKGLFIIEPNKKIAVIDSFGSLPNLTFENTWSSGSRSSEVWAVAKSGDNYSVIVKLTSTSGSSQPMVSWQIHTVSSTGTLDWGRVSTVRDPVRFERLFNLDFNEDGEIGALPNLTPIKTDEGNNVLMLDPVSKTVYIKDVAANQITFIVDPNGGTPAFFGSGRNFTFEPYAVAKNSNGSYWLAVKKTITQSGAETWEVYNLSARNEAEEATINWSRTVFTSDVKTVESLIRQDIDGDGNFGHDNSAPVFLTTDMGDVKVGENNSGFVFIQDVTAVVPVINFAGLGVKLSQEVSYSDGSFKAELMASAKVQEGGVNVYKIAVRETTVTEGLPDQITWKIYTVASNGTINNQPVSSASIATWETMFGQDLNGDQVQGINAQALSPIDGDTDLALDPSGAAYVWLNGRYIPVVGSDRGAISFDSFESVGSTTISSQAVAAQIQNNSEQDTFLLAVRSVVDDGSSFTINWDVHSLLVEGSNGNTRATVQWADSISTTDMSEYTTLFGNTDFAALQASVIGA